MESENTALLATSYFGNIHYYSKFYQYNAVWVEANENYQKQSYRNRCDIYSANGSLTLTAPLLYSNKPKTKIKDVKLDYTMDWQKVHFKSIESAYRSSPFYEFFIDELMFVFEQKEIFLYDLNQKIIHVVLELLQIDTNKLKETHQFVNPSEESLEVADFREIIHPKSKQKDPEFKPVEYHQVFQEKHGFIENLSIIDLLFNEGGNASAILNSVST